MFGPKIKIQKFEDQTIVFTVGKDVAIGFLDDDYNFKLTRAADVEMMGRVGFALEKAGPKGLKKAYGKRNLAVVGAI